jgi:mannosyltransferase
MPILILILILLLASSLRLWTIGYESYWLDEIISIRQAQMPLNEGIQLVQNDIHVPFYTILLHYWVYAFGISETSSRTLSAILGIMAVLAVYLIGKRWFSERVGLYASLMFAVSAIQVAYSQEARMYSLLVLLATISFLLFRELLDRPNALMIIGYALANVMIIYTHLFGFLVLGVQAIYYVVYYLLGKARPRNLIYGVLIMICTSASFIPWIPTFLIQVTKTGNYFWIPKPDLSSLMSLMIGYLGGTFVFCAFVGLAILAYKQNLKRDSPLLYAWAFIPVILVFIYSISSHSLFQPRYLLFTAPPMALLLCANLANLRINARLKDIAVIALAAIMVIPTLNQAYRVDKDNLRELSIFLRENANNDELIFIHPFYYEESVLYYYAPECFTDKWVYSCAYARHKVLTLYYNETCCSPATRLTSPTEQNQLRDYDKSPIWLVEIRSEFVDGGHDLFRYINGTKKLASNHSIGDIRIYHFR